jgi:hypothetical protein
MRLQLTLAAAGMAALVLAGPSRACGNGECDPPPEPPAVVINTDTDRDPHVTGQVIHYAFCCADDGQPSWRTALFRDPVQAALQCQARALRYEEKGQSLPECHLKRRAGE